MKLKEKGFTIIEMLVIIGVLAMLSGLLIIYSKSGETSANLIRETAKISSAINRAKNLTVTTTEFTQKDGNKYNPCGYGIYFETLKDPVKYIIFADLSQDCKNSSHTRNMDGSADLESEEINPSVKLNQANIQQIFFLAPDPKVFFQPESINEAEVSIKAPNGTIMGLRIGKTGQITTF